MLQISNGPHSSCSADFGITHQISNSYWTKKSAIQGVIVQVISKLGELKAQGWFENTNMIAPWIE